MKHVAFAVSLLFPLTVFAQKYSTYIGVGIGGSIEQKTAGCPKDKQGVARLAGSIAVYYAIDERFSIGPEVLASGKVSVMGGSNCIIEDVATNSLQLGSPARNASTVLFNGRYYITSPDKNLRFYAGLGVGLNTFIAKIHIGDVEKVKNRSFAVAPQAGFTISGFQFSCKFILGGKTPSFSGTDPTRNNQKVTMKGINAQQFYIHASYRLFNF